MIWWRLAVLKCLSATRITLFLSIINILLVMRGKCNVKINNNVIIILVNRIQRIKVHACIS